MNKVDRLIVQLKDESYERREAAARELGEIGDARAVEPLAESLEDRDGDVRAAAAKALGEIGDGRAVEALIRRVKRDIYLVKAWAAWALGRIGDRQAVGPLIAALTDRDWWVRTEAAWALGRIGDRRAMRPLTKAVRDKNASVRRAAARAIVQIGASEFEVSEFMRFLSSAAREHRLGAIEVLEKLGSREAVPELVRLLESDKEPSVRTAAAKALGRMRDGRAVEALVRAVRRKQEAEGRAAAAWALGQIGDPRASDVLVEALRADDCVVRWSAGSALVEMRHRAGFEWLVDLLESGNPSERQDAAKALGSWHSREALAVLRSALRRERTGAVRRELERAVEKLGVALRRRKWARRSRLAQAGPTRAGEWPARPLEAGRQNREGGGTGGRSDTNPR